MERKQVAVIFGGRSGEHVVSLRSAASIMEVIDQERFEVVPIGVTREGKWITGPDAWLSLWEKRPPVEATCALIITDPTRPGLLYQASQSSNEWLYRPLDIAFPVLHGTYGEDGTVQGLLELAGIPYVGSGVLASSVSMDKVIMKTVFYQHGLPISPYIFFYRWQWSNREQYWQDQIVKHIGYPCFVKPSNLGSSVGINKVSDPNNLATAVEEALLYDDKVIIEAFNRGREIECSVLGDIEPEASPPGEIIPCNEFYDYRAKYIDDRSELVVPAVLGPELENRVKELAIKAFLAVEARGMARVDFFVDTTSGQVTVSEINTIPGFTSISMYPKLWEAGGVSYRMLVNNLLELAKQNHKRRAALMVKPPE